MKPLVLVALLLGVVGVSADSQEFSVTHPIWKPSEDILISTRVWALPYEARRPAWITEEKDGPVLVTWKKENQFGYGQGNYITSHYLRFDSLKEALKYAEEEQKETRTVYDFHFYRLEEVTP